MPSAPPPSAVATTSTIIGNRPRHNTRVDAPPISIPGTGPKLESTVEEEELDPDALSFEFARELEKGMESLMQEITGSLVTVDKAGPSSGPDANKGDNDATPITDEDRAKTIKAAWEAMLVEGLNGMDDLDEFLGKDGVKSKTTPKNGASTANDFQSQIKQAMDKLKESESNLQVCRSSVSKRFS
jgi:peroxin-19